MRTPGQCRTHFRLFVDVDFHLYPDDQSSAGIREVREDGGGRSPSAAWCLAAASGLILQGGALCIPTKEKSGALIYESWSTTTTTTTTSNN
jgi:hypothetical protein